MFNDFMGFLVFMIITSMTPGPNNITSLSFSLHHGYRNILPYLIGIILGVFCVFLSMSLMLFYAASTSIAEVLYWMRYVGAAYIIYLAYKTWSMNVNWQNRAVSEPRFFDGFIFQAVNPKLYFFSTTTLTTFINYDQTSLFELVLLSISMMLITLICTSTWGIAGATLKVALQNRTYKMIFSGAMSLSLIYIAYRILVM